MGALLKFFLYFNVNLYYPRVCIGNFCAQYIKDFPTPLLFTYTSFCWKLYVPTPFLSTCTPLYVIVKSIKKINKKECKWIKEKWKNKHPILKECINFFYLG